MNSRDAQTALQNGARYVPGSFMHNGGMSLVLKQLFTKVFKHSPAQQGFDFNPEIPSVLQNALQSATATIVNARADYVMKNMKVFSRTTACQRSNCGGGVDRNDFTKGTAPRVALRTYE